VGRDGGPARAQPRAAFSRTNIMLYGTLILVSVYYLLPLWVMV
jgi:glucose/mannose transport system permease protein